MEEKEPSFVWRHNFYRLCNRLWCKVNKEKYIWLLNLTRSQMITWLWNLKFEYTIILLNKIVIWKFENSNFLLSPAFIATFSLFFFSHLTFPLSNTSIVKTPIKLLGGHWISNNSSPWPFHYLFFLIYICDFLFV